MVAGTHRGHVTRAAVQRELDLRHQSTCGSGAGHRHSPACRVRQRAVVGPVRVAGEDQVDGVVELRRRPDDRPGEAGAIVVPAGRQSALVDHDDDRLDALAPEPWHQAVHRLGLVVELQPRDAACDHRARRALEGQADDRDAHVLELADSVGGEHRQPAVPPAHVGGQEPEARTAETVAVAAAVHRVAAALLHAQQLIDALVELVVADRIEVEAHEVECLDRRLVVEQRRQQRTAADQVSGRHQYRVGVEGAQSRKLRREVGGAPRRHVADDAG